MYEDKFVKFTSDEIIFQREKFEYDRVYYYQVERIVVKQGFKIQRWYLLFLTGSILFLYSIKKLGEIDWINLMEKGNALAEGSFKSVISIILGFATLGVFSIIMTIVSIKRNKVAKVHYTAKNRKKVKLISLDKFISDKSLEPMIEFLKQSGVNVVQDE